MLVANFTLCTTCKNNRGARRWAGARTPIWSPPAAGRGARSLTILYNSLQLCTGETWSSPGTSSRSYAHLHVHLARAILQHYSISLFLFFTPLLFFMAGERNHSEEREGSLLSRQHFQCSSPHLKLSYSCIWHKCVDLKEWNLYLINDKIIQSSVNKWNVNY